MPAQMAEDTSLSAPHLLWLVPIALLLIALIELPYGYYQFLRLVIFATAVAIGSLTWRTSQLGALVLFGVAILYNPLFRIHLEREMWEVINVATAAIYAVHWWFIRRQPKT